MLLSLSMLNPTYVRVLWEDPIGPYLLATAAIMQIVGSLVLWKIVHIEV
jgi:Flp pilus assembly protein TadB